MNEDFTNENKTESSEENTEAKSDFVSDDEVSDESAENDSADSFIGDITSQQSSFNSYRENNVKPPKKRMPTWKVVLITVLSCILAFTIAFCAVAVSYIKSRIEDGTAASIFGGNSEPRPQVNVIEDDSDTSTLSTVQVADMVSPSVVSIVCSVPVSYNSFFYGGGSYMSQSSGTGIIVSGNGYIATNNHVVENASDIKVSLSNGQTFDAKIVGTDPQTDLAVIKIDASSITAANFGKSANLKVGEDVIAIGNPLGTNLIGSVTKGIVSAVNRKVTVDDVNYTLIQTDAAINSGNSGGPLVNMKGEVIGINSVKMASSGVEGIGFAIPSDIAVPIINDLIKDGKVSGRPMIGISGKYIDEETAKRYNLLPGVFVASVTENSGAQEAGIRYGDVITACDGKEIKSMEELNELKFTHSVGDSIVLTVARGKDISEITVVLTEENISSSTN